MAQDGSVTITQEEAKLALEALSSYLSDNDAGLPEDELKLTPYKKAMLSIKMSTGGWRPVTESIQLEKSNVVELMSGSSTMLAAQVLLPGAPHVRLAYLSMCELGIDWVHSEDIDGWRVYDGQD